MAKVKDPEVRALDAIKAAIAHLDIEARLRVLRYWVERIEEEGVLRQEPTA